MPNTREIWQGTLLKEIKELKDQHTADQAKIAELEAKLNGFIRIAEAAADHTENMRLAYVDIQSELAKHKLTYSSEVPTELGEYWVDPGQGGKRRVEEFRWEDEARWITYVRRAWKIAGPIQKPEEK